MEMFVTALRGKMRFESPVGLLTVEDLWELPLTSTSGRANLDDIARGLNKKLKSDENISFVVQERKTDTGIQTRFDIVKFIIDTLMAEKTAATAARNEKERRQKIMGIMAEKKDDNLKSLSVEELQKLLVE